MQSVYVYTASNALLFTNTKNQEVGMILQILDCACAHKGLQKPVTEWQGQNETKSSIPFFLSLSLLLFKETERRAYVWKVPLSASSSHIARHRFC